MNVVYRQGRERERDPDDDDNKNKINKKILSEVTMSPHVNEKKAT